MADEEPTFEGLLSGQYGQVEAHLGHEGYQANVELTRSQAEANRSIGKMHEAQAMYLTGQSSLYFARARFIRMIGSLLVVAGIAILPAIVRWVWIWAWHG